MLLATAGAPVCGAHAERESHLGLIRQMISTPAELSIGGGINIRVCVTLMRSAAEYSAGRLRRPVQVVCISIVVGRPVAPLQGCLRRLDWDQLDD